MSGNTPFKVSALALVGFFATVSPSLSEEKCVPRSGNFNLHPNQHFAGMFRLPLNSPDFYDSVALQRHLAFSTIWADVLMRELPTKAGGLCGAFVTAYGFPDLRVFLFVNRTGSQIDREKAVCTRALEDILQGSQPSDDLIRRAAARTALFRQPAQPPLEGILDSSNILGVALPLIYAKNSPLHALASVDWNAYRTIDATDFRTWLQSQSSREHPPFEPISHCLPPSQDPGSASGVPEPRRNSDILSPGEINLSRSTSGIPPGPLRYAVVIGTAAGPTSPMAVTEISAKYCNREHSFLIGDEASPHATATVRLRCLDTTVNDLDSWGLIYCDPADCTSARTDRIVMEAIVSDPDVLSYVRKISGAGSPRGPYLVTVN
jgi:hypothetical protein